MAYLVAPRPLDPSLPVFYNVEGPVGAPPALNKGEDVLLVQFAFKVIARSPRSNTPPELLTAAKAVDLTGNIDTATITAITTMQAAQQKKIRTKVVDGRVSPAKNGYHYGGGFWTIVRLNDSIQRRHINVWPRIDRIPGCPHRLKKMVIRQVVGTK